MRAPPKLSLREVRGPSGAIGTDIWGQSQVNGKIEPFQDNELRTDRLGSSCDIESCAIRQDAWDGPVMSCYCQDASGDWKLASVDLSEHILIPSHPVF